MVFKFRFKVGGGHTHVRVFAGKDADHLGKCGDLTMTNEEWDSFGLALAMGAGGICAAVPPGLEAKIEFVPESEPGSHDRIAEGS